MEAKNNNKEWLTVLLSIFLSVFAVAALAAILAMLQKTFESKLSPTFNWRQVLGIQTVYAAPLKGYEALQVSANSQITMKSGETKNVSISFQNIGTEVWKNSGTNFVSVYTYEPKYRTSVFYDSSWYAKDQPVKLTESSVAVNKVGTISFKLTAPSQGGTYKETFALAAEDKAWIPGGQFTITINVSSTTSVVTSTSPTVSTDGDTSSSTNGYTATLLVKSVKKTIQAKGGEVVSFTVGFKNSGSKTWTSRSIKTPSINVASLISYADTSWSDSSTAVVKNDGPVSPGALDLIAFKFKAPIKKGTYAAKFVLAADSVTVPGGEVEIPIEVTSDAPEARNSQKTSAIEDTASYIDEPTIRVGVLIVDDETDNKVNITCESDFDVVDGNGNLLAEVEKDDEVEAFYRKNKYWFDRGKGLEKSSFYLRFVPDTANAVCTVTNFDRRETRNAANADNQFRNTLELRYNDSKDRVWLINELPMEYYLRGLAETSNLSNLDFQKALITAARTYAFYHWERATKHAAEYFHVDAYADQVYNGYGQEARTPRLTQAVEETNGHIVTYDGATAITPYFSRSDGRTRDWSEVWGGSVPWCVSVKTPHDKGKKLWGHGVGISASEALAMGNDGDDWQTIVKYFYTGIDIVKKWK